MPETPDQQAATHSIQAILDTAQASLSIELQGAEPVARHLSQRLFDAFTASIDECYSSDGDFRSDYRIYGPAWAKFLLEDWHGRMLERSAS